MFTAQLDVPSRTGRRRGRGGHQHRWRGRRGNALPALQARSLGASLDEVGDTVKKIDNSFLLQDEDPYGNHLSTSGAPHGYWGANSVGPG
jgi:hypothetical protein